MPHNVSTLCITLLDIHTTINYNIYIGLYKSDDKN